MQWKNCNSIQSAQDVKDTQMQQKPNYDIFPEKKRFNGHKLMK